MSSWLKIAKRKTNETVNRFVNQFEIGMPLMRFLNAKPVKCVLEKSGAKKTKANKNGDMNFDPEIFTLSLKGRQHIWSTYMRIVPCQGQNYALSAVRECSKYSKLTGLATDYILQKLLVAMEKDLSWVGLQEAILDAIYGNV